MDYLSHSKLEAFQACPRRYQWRYVLGVTKIQRAVSLRFGSAYHLGLDALKTGASIEEAVSRILEEMKHPPPFLDIESWLVERETCIRLLVAWDSYHEPLEWISSEEPFDVRIRNPATGRPSTRHRLRGIWDGKALYGGRRMVVEHKTTSRPLELHGDYVRRLRVDSQVSRYLSAATDCDGVLYDITRKPQIRPKKVSKKDLEALRSTGLYQGLHVSKMPSGDRETPEMFGNRLFAVIAADPKKYFLRLLVPRTRQDLKREAEDLWSLQKTVARSRFPRNTQACLAPYRCDFADLCLNGIHPDAIEDLPDGYQRKERS